MLAIIGGATMSKIEALKIVRREIVRTPYGEPSCALLFGTLYEQEIVFIARHGYGHTIAPQEINYRANIWALAAQGVTEVVAILSVGAIRPDLEPGMLVVPDQIIDYTHDRISTYYQSGGQKMVEYIDFTEPYCAQLRKKILDAATKANEKMVDHGVYAVTTGVRLETAAEIRRIEKDGGDMVGMTGMPEAVLARELNLSYAAIAMVTNYAAGKGDSEHQVDFRAANAAFQGEVAGLHRILANFTCPQGK